MHADQACLLPLDVEALSAKANKVPKGQRHQMMYLPRQRELIMALWIQQVASSTPDKYQNPACAGQGCAAEAEGWHWLRSECMEEQAAWMKEAAGDPISARKLAAGQAWQSRRVEPEAAVKRLVESVAGKEVTTEVGQNRETRRFGSEVVREATKR